MCRRGFPPQFVPCMREARKLETSRMDGERTGADRVHGSSRFRWAYRPACHAFALFRRPPWRCSSQVLTGRRDTGEAPTTGQAPWRRGETSKTQSRGAIVRRSAFVALTAALLIFTPLLALELAARWTAPPSLERAGHTSTIVLDRRDRLLRAFTTPDGIWRLPVAVSDVDTRYLDMLLAFEDRRFRAHGVQLDPACLQRGGPAAGGPALPGAAV